MVLADGRQIERMTRNGRKRKVGSCDVEPLPKQAVYAPAATTWLGVEMAGYFGTDVQQRLQAQVESSVGFINATPGACHGRRFMSCDDLDRLGWSQIQAILDRDGICGFRLIPAGRLDELRRQLALRNYRLDTWDVFLGDAATAVVASEWILSRRLPEGLTDLPPPTDPESAYTRRIQELMYSTGVVPFSGSALTGSLDQATTVVVGDEKGDIIAAAHGHLPHNAHSPYHRYGWGGLVSVAQPWRGNGLGRYINARMIVGVVRDLGATHVYELVSATNLPSRRVVTSCGLHLEPALGCGIATPNGSVRFTQ